MLTKLKALREEREEGFTLIELLVVILIIGILAAIAIPVFLNQRQTANDGAVQSDVKNVATQVESWIVGQKGANTPIADTAAVVGPPAVPAGTNFTDIKNAVKPSAGVHIAIKGTANDYCIKAVHDNGKQYKGAAADTATANVLTYNNTLGGIGKGDPSAASTDACKSGGTWNVIS